MKHSKLYALCFAAMLLLCTLAACSDDFGAEDSGTENATPANSTPETEAIDPLAAADFVPDNISYDGETFTVIHGNGWNLVASGYTTSSYNEVAPDPETVKRGDIIDEAVVLRNSMTSEKLDIKIVSIEKGCFEFNRDISISVMAGDNAYDAVCGTVRTVFDCAVEGLLTPLTNIETLDLSHEWWDQKVKEQYSYGENNDIVYFINGDINYLDNYGSMLLLFNKDMLSDYNLESPYDLVRNYTWTFDKMMQMSSNIYQDLDNDGVQTIDDQYGLVANNGVLDRLIPASGLSVIVPKDSDSMCYTVNQNEVFFNALDKFYDGLINHNSAFYDGGSYPSIFSAGRALFCENLLSSVPGSRGMEDDFGVIPFPLYDEDQKQYYAPISYMYGSAYAVIQTADSDRAGYVLDVMGAFSADTITEAVIDKTCLVKSVRDEETAEMLYIIFDGAVYGGNTLEDWGGTYDIMYEMIYYKKNNFASQIASIKKMVEIVSARELKQLANPD